MLRHREKAHRWRTSKARMAAWDRRVAAHIRRRCTHEAQLERMLIRGLSPEQRLSWCRGWIWVHGSERGIFWLSPHATIEVTRSLETHGWCIHGAHGRNLESMLSIKLMLETHEPYFRSLAHWEGPIPSHERTHVALESYLHMLYCLAIDDANDMTDEQYRGMLRDYAAGEPPPEEREEAL